MWDTDTIWTLRMKISEIVLADKTGVSWDKWSNSKPKKADFPMSRKKSSVFPLTRKWRWARYD